MGEGRGTQSFGLVEKGRMLNEIKVITDKSVRVKNCLLEGNI